MKRLHRGRHIADYDDAWDIVKRVDHPNLGIVLDTFHMFARGNTLDTLKKGDIPVEKIGLVQLADAPKMQMDILRYSRHYRCFPGPGVISLLLSLFRHLKTKVTTITCRMKCLMMSSALRLQLKKRLMVCAL
ncbi:sugar phosphate isomerase/epimerase [Vibrio sp. M60_M31a]